MTSISQKNAGEEFAISERFIQNDLKEQRFMGTNHIQLHHALRENV